MIRPRHLDRRGFLALLRACKERPRLTARRDYFLIYLAGRTGLREAELLATRVRDLSLETDPPFVSVDSLKQRRKPAVDGRKGKKPRPPAPDQVLLEATTVKRSRRYIAGVLRQTLGRAARPNDHLFPSTVQVMRAIRLVERCRSEDPHAVPDVASELNAAIMGPTRPMSVRNVRRIFAFYARRARLRPGVSFHSLRHFRGMTVYHASGRDLEFTRQQLRHRFISSTQQYLGVDPEQERRYLDALERGATTRPTRSPAAPPLRST